MHTDSQPANPLIVMLSSSAQVVIRPSSHFLKNKFQKTFFRRSFFILQLIAAILLFIPYWRPILALVGGSGRRVAGLPSILQTSSSFGKCARHRLISSTSAFALLLKMVYFQNLKIVYLTGKIINLHGFQVVKAFIPTAGFLLTFNTSLMLKASTSSTSTWANRLAP